MKNSVIKATLAFTLFLFYSVMGLNVGGDGTSPDDAMVYYLVGEEETYP